MANGENCNGCDTTLIIQSASIAMLVLGIAIAAFYAGHQHDLRLSESFERVRPGMFATQAEAILGLGPLKGIHSSARM